MQIELTEEEAKIVLHCMVYALSRNPTMPIESSNLLTNLSRRIAAAKSKSIYAPCGAFRAWCGKTQDCGCYDICPVSIHVQNRR